jgi:hypothetical protein
MLSPGFFAPRWSGALDGAIIEADPNPTSPLFQTDLKKKVP